MAPGSRAFEDWYEHDQHDQEPRLSSRTARVASRSGTYLSEYTERWVPALASLGRDDNSQESLFLKAGVIHSPSPTSFWDVDKANAAAERDADARATRSQE